MPQLPDQPIDHAASARSVTRAVSDSNVTASLEQTIAFGQLHATLALVDVLKDIRSELRKARR